MRIYWKVLGATAASIIVKLLLCFAAGSPVLCGIILFYDLILFGVMYFIGKTLDLKGDFGAIAISLLLGCVMGNVITLFFLYRSILLKYLHSIVVEIGYYSISSFLFGLAGLGFGYLMESTSLLKHQKRKREKESSKRPLKELGEEIAGKEEEGSNSENS
jgi:hypothetical protein